MKNRKRGTSKRFGTNYDLARARRLFEDASDILAVAVAHLEGAISAFRGGATSAEGPGSPRNLIREHIEKSYGVCKDPWAAAAPAPPAAAKPRSGGGRARKTRGSEHGPHSHTSKYGWAWCAKCNPQTHLKGCRCVQCIGEAPSSRSDRHPRPKSSGRS